MARDTWYRLDTVGKFYSSQAGSSVQTVFRFSATLLDEVDADILQYALNKTVDIFPSFNVCLRSGMFWHYLEQAANPPQVSLESLPICYGLHVDTKSVLFRVTYYRNRINFEVSHIVSDGRGSLNFFKALLYAYVQQRYQIEGIPLEYDGSDRQKAENSFEKYYERVTAETSSHADTTLPPKPKLYRFSGFRDEADPTYIEYHLPTDKVRDLAKSYGVSLTSLIIAALMYAIRQEMSQRERSRAIRIDIPVDLRQIFESETTKNFFGLAYVSYVPKKNETVKEIAPHIQDELKSAIQEEQITPRINRLITLEKNLLLRYVPLFVKDMLLALGDWWVARDTTTTISNLGPIQLDKRAVPYVRDINILTSTSGMKLVICSLENDLSIGISTVYSNLDVVKNFCRFFSGENIKGHINISKTSEEMAVDLLEVKFETSVKRLSDQLSRSNESAEDSNDKSTNDSNKIKKPKGSKEIGGQ